MTELQQVERLVNLTVGKVITFGIFLLILGTRGLLHAIGRWWAWLRRRSIATVDAS